MERNEEMTGTRDIAGGGAVSATDTEPRERERFERDAEATDTARPVDRETATDEVTGTREVTEAAGRADEPVDRESDMRALLPEDEQSSFRGRWEEIQTRFVDDPRRAVEDADALVATLMQRLADGFASERERLEGMWGRGEDVGTEDLRVALQRYRSFFQRLLAA